MKENSLYDKKSIRELTCKNPDWNEIAKDCVAFSNAQGGTIDYGIENDSDEPPIGQVIDENLPVALMNKINSKTTNVTAFAEIVTHKNGAQYISLHISRGHTVASTSSGKYYLRIADNSVPLIGNDIARLAAEKGYFSWEDQVTKWSWKESDPIKLESLLSKLNSSERVSSFVKQKEIKELLDYYFLTEEESDKMTNLGVLFIGTQSQRGRLMNSPVVQCIKYDENGEKVQKYLWDDFLRTPEEIIEDIWQRVPDWKETNEISDGLFRKEIPAYDKDVIRELVCNALVHRPYTISGDIFINIHPNRIEVKNPGTLPLGVTPENILHKTVKRNEHFANLCYALRLMEREGSGYDKMYEIQLSNGKQVPRVLEGEDFVTAIIERRIISKESIKVIREALQMADLKQKQIICLGLIAQHESISAANLINILDLKDRDELSPWLNPLLEYGIIHSTGSHRAKEYRVNSPVLKQSDYKGKTSLKRIEDYRIKELIIEDLKIYSCAPMKDIHQRIGKEIPYKRILSQMKSLVHDNIIKEIGHNRWVKYLLIKE
ncbi:MAG: putative DNA binding domain-containing protein [Bacteroidales bacterium]|nr:putative DNA binding domain-containing protein [Bacteroidales bacterium]